MLLGPTGLLGKYRKLHLPYLGVDRFVNHGDLPLTVYDTDIGRIGLGICYDSGFPEHARVLALEGADIVVIITNWPEGAEFSAEHTTPTRARENHVFYVAINRVGKERNVNFFGLSKIADCRGEFLAAAKLNQEDIIYAEIEPVLAREKYRVRVPGESESHLINDRRPEFYEAITRPLADTSRLR